MLFNYIVISANSNSILSTKDKFLRKEHEVTHLSCHRIIY